jgi:predicted nucleic acid-binding protein
MTIELIYWDSAVFLAYFQNEPNRVDLCQETLDRAEAGEVGIITSTLSITECLWLRGKEPIPKDRGVVVQRFFRRSFIRVRNLTRNIAETAQNIVWDHQIKPKDAVHVATALESRIQVLETFDMGLIGRTGTIGKPVLIIRKPVGNVQMRMPL